MPVLVHVAQTPVLAGMLKDLLLQAGIESTIAPATDRRGWWDAKPTDVWIADESDLEGARAIVAEFEKQSQGTTGWNWRCSKCGEMVEAQFTECWKCGQSRKG